MAGEFEDLGLSETVLEAARAAGYERPTPVQAAAMPVLRRGGNVVLHASAGAGITAAFGLPLLDRLATAETVEAGLRALVLVPTADRAEAVAQGLSVLAGATGVRVRATGSGWRAGTADVLVATAEQALSLVQSSALKLEALQTLVIMDAAELFALGAAAALDTVVSLVPREAQRVVTSATLGNEVERLLEAHARKALTVPARPAAPPRTTEAREPIGQIGYMIATESEKPHVLARLLESVEEGALVYARTRTRAEAVMRELSRRGIADGRAFIRAVDFGTAAEPASRVISYDVPFSADDLRRFHEQGGTVLVTPAERAHLRRMAAEVAFTLKHRRPREQDTNALDAFRASVRTAVETEDLDAQLLMLEPLLEQYGAAEVAAALSALVRRRAPAPTSAPGSAAGAAPAAASTAGFTRLFVSVGARDNIRPGDLVGAITGEANIKGDQVGRVDIRESFSVVEVAAAVADRVIGALNGTTMRGRSLRVDFDRKGTGGGGARGPRDDTARGGPPRGGPRGAPRSGPGGARPRGAGAPRGAAPRRGPPED